MIRAFIALALPESHITALQAVQARLPVPRVVPPENLHLTLAFLGEQPEETLEEVHEALTTVVARPVKVTLTGLGLIGGAQPRGVFAGVSDSKTLLALRKSVEKATRSAGLTLERRRFTPHVTLARTRPGQVNATELTTTLLQTPLMLEPVKLHAFHLFSSTLHPEGARYEVLASYPLTG